MRNPFAVLYRWCKRIWAPNPFVVLLRNAHTDLPIRIWTILVPIRLKNREKNGFGQFSHKLFGPIRVGLKDKEEKKSPQQAAPGDRALAGVFGVWNNHPRKVYLGAGEILDKLLYLDHMSFCDPQLILLT